MDNYNAVYFAPDGWFIGCRLHVRLNGSLFIDAQVNDRRLKHYSARYIGVSHSSSQAIAETLGNFAASLGLTVTDDDLSVIADRLFEAIEQLLK